MTTRNQIFGALFNLTNGLVIDTVAGQFVTRSRKFKHFSKVSADQQPAMFQTEVLDHGTAKTGLPGIRKFRVSWTVYFTSDPGDDGDIPTIAMNDIVDALEGVLIEPFNKQTLGGLVEHTFIDGEIIKISGDDDGQGMIVVPITILVP